MTDYEVPTTTPTGYALAAFQLARVNLTALLDARVITRQEAVDLIKFILPELPSDQNGQGAKDLLNAVANSIELNSEK